METETVSFGQYAWEVIYTEVASNCVRFECRETNPDGSYRVAASVRTRVTGTAHRNRADAPVVFEGSVSGNGCVDCSTEDLLHWCDGREARAWCELMMAAVQAAYRRVEEAEGGDWMEA